MRSVRPASRWRSQPVHARTYDIIFWSTCVYSMRFNYQKSSSADRLETPVATDNGQVFIEAVIQFHSRVNSMSRTPRVYSRGDRWELNTDKNYPCKFNDWFRLLVSNLVLGISEHRGLWVFDMGKITFAWYEFSPPPPDRIILIAVLLIAIWHFFSLNRVALTRVSFPISRCSFITMSWNADG